MSVFHSPRLIWTVEISRHGDLEYCSLILIGLMAIKMALDVNSEEFRFKDCNPAFFARITSEYGVVPQNIALYQSAGATPQFVEPLWTISQP